MAKFQCKQHQFFLRRVIICWRFCRIQMFKFLRPWALWHAAFNWHRAAMTKSLFGRFLIKIQLELFSSQILGRRIELFFPLFSNFWIYQKIEKCFLIQSKILQLWPPITLTTTTRVNLLDAVCRRTFDFGLETRVRLLLWPSLRREPSD